jgi:hypothetical protein
MDYLYEERVTFHPIIGVVYGLLLVVLAWQILFGTGHVAVMLLVSAFLVILPLLFGYLKILVDHEVLWVRFGFVGWPAQRIPLKEIENVRVIDYKPVRQFGGWGIRIGRFEGQSVSAYTLRGNRGALLELAKERRIGGVKTRRFLIGTAEPERLKSILGV